MLTYFSTPFLPTYHLILTSHDIYMYNLTK